MQANIGHIMLVIFVVAISVCLITGLFISHLTLKTSVKDFLTNSNLPSLWIKADKITQQDEDFLSNYDYSKRCSFETNLYLDNIIIS